MTKTVFAEFHGSVRGSVRFGDGSIVEICGRGNLIFECKNLEHKLLTDVYYIPRLKSSILSLGQLDEGGCKIVIAGGNMTIHDGEQRMIANVQRSGNRLYVLELHLTKPICLPSEDNSEAWLWHKRYEHLNFRALESMSQKGMVVGLPKIDHIEQICEGCLVGKQKRKPFCEDQGIRRFTTAPYTPQQNGVVQRRNQTVVTMARSLLKDMKMPAYFWGEAVTTAVYLLNRAFTKSIQGKTPYEVWRKKKPNISHLRTFGCIAHVKTALPHLSKLQDRSKAMIFIGYEPGSKAYRCYDTNTQRLHISRDIVFDESKHWDWDSEQVQGKIQESDMGTFTVVYQKTDRTDEVSDRGITEGTDGNFESLDPQVNSRSTPESQVYEIPGITHPLPTELDYSSDLDSSTVQIN